MRIGIDVGGTNTDAVLMDERRVLAEVKTPTTPDVTSGIVAALRTLIADSGVEAAAVQAVMIGTTHFTNAVVEAKRPQPAARRPPRLPAPHGPPPRGRAPEPRAGAAAGRERQPRLPRTRRARVRRTRDLGARPRRASRDRRGYRRARNSLCGDLLGLLPGEHRVRAAYGGDRVRDAARRDDQP